MRCPSRSLRPFAYAFRLTLLLALAALLLPTQHTLAENAAIPAQKTAVAPAGHPIVPTSMHPVNRRVNPDLPIAFAANQGQSPAGTLYEAQTGRLQVMLTNASVTLRIAHPDSTSAQTAPSANAASAAGEGPSKSNSPRSFTVEEQHLQFVGANPDVTLEPLDEQPGKINYFLGNDPSRWIKGLKTYARVRYHNLYPGIDMVFYSHNGQLEYDFVVAAGADPNQIHLRIDGDNPAQVTARGELQIGSGKNAVLHWPVLYQNLGNGKKLVEGKFVSLADNTVGFQFADYDKTKTFIIDPTVTLLYSTYLGGVHNDEAHDLVLDKANNVYIVGYSASENFPVSANAYQTTRKNIGVYVRNVVVAKFNSSGALLYSTFIGGSVNDYGYSIALDSSNDAFVTGYTNSSDYPTTQNALQTTSAPGGKTAFLSELSPDGTTLKYSTYYGPTAAGGISRGYQVISDGKNNIYLGGYAGSGLPTTAGTYKSNLATGAGNNGFIAIFNFSQSSGSPLVAATYYGTDTPQTNNVFTGDKLLGLALDASGNIWFSGQGYTNNLPTTVNAQQPTVNALSAGCNPGAVPLNSAAYYGELSSNLQNLLYASYLSGQTEAAAEASCSEWAWKLAFDPSGNLYVYGVTASDKFPVTSGALQTTFMGSGNGGWVSYLMKFGSNGTKTSWGTYLGGSPGQTLPAKVIVDSAGNPWVAGLTQATNFPTAGSPYQATLAGQQNGFITELNPNGSQALYSTYFGGNATDSLNAFALDAASNIYVAGATNSNNFPVTANAFQSTLAQGKLDGSNWFFSELGSGTISVISPLVAGNSGDDTITLGGTGFQPGATCDLAQGTTIITATTAVVSADGTSMTCTFALNGAATGSYTVQVTNPNNTTLTAAGTLQVETGAGPNIYANIVGRPAIRQGVPTTFYVQYGNSGDADAIFTWLYIAVPDNLQLTPLFTPQPVPAVKGYNTIDPSQIPVTYSQNGMTILALILPRIPAGGVGSLPIQVTGPTNDSGFQIQVFTNPPWFDSLQTAMSSLQAASEQPLDLKLGLDATSYGLVFPGANGAGKSTPHGLLSPNQAADLNCFSALLAGGGAIAALGASSAVAGPVIGAAFAFNVVSQLANPTTTQFGPFSVNDFAGSTVAGAAGYLGAPLLGSQAAALAGPVAYAAYSIGSGLYSGSLQSNCNQFAKDAGNFFHSFIKSSIDPNDKAGPNGSGSPNFYVTASHPFTYTLAFENSPTASLPAANVVVTDQLDPTKFNLKTLALGSIFFGTTTITPPAATNVYNTVSSINSSLSVKIAGSLNQQTGLLKWTFTTIDPSTGLPPTDPTVGFLPPDVNGIVGQGGVSFTVAPASGQATGVQIANTASVVFDANAPINTPTWTNTLDVNAPTSAVQALPATEAASTFNVTWSGTDVGSGIASYDVYVSDNAGPFFQWQSSTTNTSASFSGASGHTYGFYSIARDNAGNVEAPKSAAEATTQVIASANFALAASAGSLSITPGQNGTVGLSVTPVNGFNAPVSFACSGLPSEATCTFSPATVTPNGTAAASTTLTITTTAPSARKRPLSEKASRRASGWTGGALAAGFLLFPFLYKKRRLGMMLVLLCTLSTLGTIACGGGSSSSSNPPPVTNPGTPAGASTVTVTASSGTGTSAVSHTTTITLTVQ